MQSTARTIGLLACCAVGLVACDRLRGGDDSKGAEPAQSAAPTGAASSKPATAGSTAEAPAKKHAASGIWKGTFKSGGFHGYVIGLVTETGGSRFVSSDGVQFVGSMKVHKTKAMGSFRTYVDHTLSVSYDFTATLTPERTLNGSYGNPRDSGTFALDYSKEYERQVSLADVADRWGSAGFAMVVEPSGTFTGKDSAGCQYQGNLAVVDARYNALTVTFSVSACRFEGDYTGLTFLSDAKTKNDLLVYGASRGSHAHAGYLARGAELGGGADVLSAVDEARRAHGKAQEAHGKARDAHSKAKSAANEALRGLR